MTSTAAAPDVEPRTERRLLGVLLAAVVCGSTGHSMIMAVGSIVAADLTGTNTWAGLPVAVGALGTALASLPLARLMGRFGRRPGLVLGYALAILGAGLAMAGVLTHGFPLFLLGMALFGVSNTSTQLARYAAADVSTIAQRGRAIGLIVWGVTVGAIVGPNLLDLAARVAGPLGLPAAGSPFLVALVGFALAALLIAVLLRPDPFAVARRVAEPRGVNLAPAPARPLGVILRQPAV